MQSDGEAWRNFRNGPLPRVGLWAMVAVVGVLALFFLLRGRIRIEHGWAGRTITRFTEIERIGHWLLAVSFIILALTGLNVLYGRYALLPLIGADAFSAISIAGKWLHNYVAFAFMVGLLLTFVVWVRHNFPSWRDVVWLAKGGGMFVKGSHPPAWKFNAGQKILFWLIMLGGLSLSLSGLALMFPFQTALFGKTFALVNMLGFHLPTELTPVQEMQYATSWHGIVALALVVVSSPTSTSAPSACRVHSRRWARARSTSTGPGSTTACGPSARSKGWRRRRPPRPVPRDRLRRSEQPACARYTGPEENRNASLHPEPRRPGCDHGGVGSRAAADADVGKRRVLVQAQRAAVMSSRNSRSEYPGSSAALPRPQVPALGLRPRPG